MGDLLAPTPVVGVLTPEQIYALLERAAEAGALRALASLPSATPKPAMMTVAEVATEFRQHQRTVRRMLTDGRLRPHRTGAGGSARVLVARADVEALLGGCK